MIKSFFILILSSVIFLEGLLPKSVGFSEAYKFGDLYSHYQQHKQEGISFEDFLWMHYAKESKHKSNQEHKKLPSFESHITFLVFIPAAKIISEFSKSVTFFEGKSSSSTYQNLYRFQYLKSLLNPPQLG
ncbi:hypothetical protein EGI22_15665 [Lacihabitans sp. LS3-19]|uniref:hypothetical protein n=1 Tax=Lacihabitans sp. LS3-19 TaxID=2487335 RepID=UPI0020CCF3E1|nr:hypothetical protein [Lacihabitans sp. LS3-19]MCP9768955.1 hypothetical protein [Lacihabitans sp. LS3-19]MCP9769303.1 hypothetical protein [Lacihabitans sp. LS3-19]MCP9769348.1 hypothetical protein [Lacihabitans sp. LS3-19]